jgi:hypothetical protein
MSEQSKTRTWIIVGAIVALVLVAGFAALALSGSDDPEAVAGAVSGGTGDISETQPVSLSGNALPQMPQEGADPALGLAAPELRGSSFDGSTVEITHDGTPKIILFLTHW